MLKRIALAAVATLLLPTLSAQGTPTPRLDFRSMSSTELVEQLRDDDIPHNARAAVHTLRMRNNEETFRALEEGLLSDDPQQRMLTLECLIYRSELLYPFRTEPFAVLVEQLRADDIRKNALSAMSAMGPNECLTPACLDILEEALDSEDHQQRQMAGNRLAWALPVDGREPSQRLLEVLVEALRDDELPRELKEPTSENQQGPRYYYGWTNNAMGALRFFLHTAPEAATPLLEEALDSEDAQQRFLAAYVLGATGRSARANRIVEIMIPCLEKGHFMHHQAMACYALYHLGEPVIPLITPLLEDEDPNVRMAIGLVLADLADPPSNQVERRLRYEQFPLLPFLDDPAVEPFVRSWMGDH